MSPQNTTFPSNGSTAHGYLALPPGGTGPGLVVIQEWWGLTTHIEDVTNRFAAAGFVALAPDLYGGRTTHDGEEAAKMASGLPLEKAVQDLSGAVQHLLEHEAVTSSTVGAVGFCMGGGFVLALAAQEADRISAAVSFYGVIDGEALDVSSLTASVQGHFGEQDETAPPSAARALMARIEEASGHAPELHVYDAGHAFFNDENLIGTYSPADAELAWGRTLEFLHARVR